MHVSRTQVLTVVFAVGILAVLQMPGFFGDQTPVDEWTPPQREPVLVRQNPAPPFLDSGTAKARASHHALPFAPIEPESPGVSTATTQHLHPNQDRYRELARITELEAQPVDNALTELLPMLDDDDPAVRRAVVEAISDMSSVAAGLTLTTALGDPDPRVRTIALEGLAAHEAWLAVGSIEPYLHDQDTTVRLAAIEALLDLGSETAVHALAGLLYDQDSTIRRHAVSALGDIGGNEAKRYLRQARYDPDASVRAHASYILSELTYDAEE